jgi:hypothetical protein
VLLTVLLTVLLAAPLTVLLTALRAGPAVPHPAGAILVTAN